MNDTLSRQKKILLFQAISNHKPEKGTPPKIDIKQAGEIYSSRRQAKSAIQSLVYEGFLENHEVNGKPVPGTFIVTAAPKEVRQRVQEEHPEKYESLFTTEEEEDDSD